MISMSSTSHPFCGIHHKESEIDELLGTRETLFAHLGRFEVEFDDDKERLELYQSLKLRLALMIDAAVTESIVHASVKKRVDDGIILLVNNNYQREKEAS
jgi:hypothetical protein